MATEINITITPIKEYPHIKVIKLNGEIDESNLINLQKQIEPLYEDDSSKILIFNLQDLIYINSKVIGYFASYYTKLSQTDKKMVFAEANPNIMDILSLVGLTNIIEYFETESEAINALIVS